MLELVLAISTQAILDNNDNDSAGNEACCDIVVVAVHVRTAHGKAAAVNDEQNGMLFGLKPRLS